MTYFGVLAAFILPPLIALALWVSRRTAPPRRAWIALAGHVLVALVYTTPWDNYLVATGVWWYDPALVTGLTLGYVPIEEYSFFVLQTLLAGLWLLALSGRGLPRLSLRSEPARPALCRWAVITLGVLWLASTAILLAGWSAGRYLALILVWALPPVGLQLAFGADILWAKRRLLLAAVGLPTLYLWAVDLLAISSGTWSIDPAQTTGLKLGVLPLEEMVFFLMTNVLVVFGMTLLLDGTSQRRARQIVARLRRAR